MTSQNFKVAQNDEMFRINDVKHYQRTLKEIRQQKDEMRRKLAELDEREESILLSLDGILMPGDSELETESETESEPEAEPEAVSQTKEDPRGYTEYQGEFEKEGFTFVWDDFCGNSGHYKRKPDA